MLSLFVAVDLGVEAFLPSSPRRSVSGIRRVAQHCALIPVPDRLYLPRLDAPVARSEASKKQRLELGGWARHHERKGREPTVVGEHLHQHPEVRDKGKRL